LPDRKNLHTNIVRTKLNASWNESTETGKTLRRLRQANDLAAEMETQLGRGEILFRRVPAK
jgi:hypothetical protein